MLAAERGEALFEVSLLAFAFGQVAEVAQVLHDLVVALGQAGRHECFHSGPDCLAASSE